MKLKFLFILILSSIIQQANAQTGCLSGGGNLYTFNSGSYLSRPMYDWNGNVSDPNRISNAASVRCLRILPTPNSCYIKYPRTVNTNCTGAAGSDATYCYDAATLYNYSALPCPLDMNLTLLILPIIAYGFIFIRRRIKIDLI